ncbi:MAG: hypothetical protein ACC662_03925, partial [Planctomycetota bacterium]
MVGAGSSFLLAFVLFACGGSGPAPQVAAGSSAAPPGAIPAPPPVDVPLDVVITRLTASPGTAPGTVLLRFPAPGAVGKGPADAYVVRSSVRHLTEENLDASTMHAVEAAPAAPGTVETIPVTGLEPGRTLQFTVQARRKGAL